MSNTDLLARLARACAHGPRQLELVNEMLAGEAYMRAVPIPGMYYSKYNMTVRVGDAGVGAASFKSLKTRLIQNGFMVKLGEWEDDYRTIELRFSV